MPNNHEFNHQPTETTGDDFIKMAADAPSFQEHLEASADLDRPTKNYDTIIDLNKNLPEALFDKGLNRSFAENPAFDRILGATGLFQTAFNNSKGDHYLDQQDHSYAFNFKYGNNYLGNPTGEIDNSVNILSPTEFSVRMRDNKPSWTGSDGRDYTEVDETITTYSLNQDGHIMAETQNAHYLGGTNPGQENYTVHHGRSATYREFSENGQEVRSDYIIFKPITLKDASPSTNTAFFKAPMTKEDRYGTNIEYHEVLERTNDHEMRVTITELGPDGKSKSYSEIEPINSEHGTDDLVSQNGHQRELA